MRKNGGEIMLCDKVNGISRRQTFFTLQTTKGDVQAKNIINCGGLYSDSLARMMGLEGGLRIVPFRGEYYFVRPEAHHLVKGLIYPVPDPAFPFLGVHFTRMIHGGVEAGPNAVLGLGREGYSWKAVAPGDLMEMATFPGLWRMAGKHWRMGLAECYRSLSKRAFHRALAALVPELK